MMAARWLAPVLAAVACASPATIPTPRFDNARATAVVDDRHDVARTPESRLFVADLYQFDGVVYRRLARSLELPRARRALGVNALDEVPDSTWFTNRIGARALAPEDVRAGPLTSDSPERHRPWTVRSTKIGGTSLGLIVKDARGVKYLVKFDGKTSPEIETATHVIVNRLLWAAGYNVPEDQIVWFLPDDLVVAPDATLKHPDGSDAGLLDRATLLRALDAIYHEPGGRIRALVSRWIDGKVIGGPPAEGVRDDDPNDRIPHELRRDLRGAYPIFAWLDHVDLQEGNFLDSWVTDPADQKRHNVKHYLIDFGKSLGAMASLAPDARRGHTYVFDLPDIAWTFVTLGATDRDWQHRAFPALRGIGMYDAATFDPGDWHPDSPAYVPMLNADPIDKFWGAKIVARFTRAQLAAAVAAGHLSDPRAAAYLVDTLVARQRATAAYWFARVNPLDGFALVATPDGDTLCFDDLAISAGLASAATTRYELAGFDFAGVRVGAPVARAATGARSCVPVPGLAPGWDHDAYTILRLATVRPGFTGETFVHAARAQDSGAASVIGVWRP